jgi:hypothetical protein
MSCESAAILEQARAAYLAGVVSHRETMLDVGRLLHTYLLAWLRQQTEAERKRSGPLIHTREEGVRRAAAALQCPRSRINWMITAAMVVELFGRRPFGNLALNCLVTFGVFISRKIVGLGPDADRAHVDPADYETWLIRPETATTAVELYDRMVNEQWTNKQTLQYCGFRRRSQPKRRPVPHKTNRFAEVAASMKYASPGDVAASCRELIEAAVDPGAVAIRLRVLLEKYLPRQKARCGHAS